MTSAGCEDLLRELAPQVLGALVRRYGQLDACEDAVQWPSRGVPSHPRGWLLTAARRALVDQWRSESARRGREERVAREDPVTRGWGPAGTDPAAEDVEGPGDRADADDTLALLFLCCHPALSPPAQLALTLRAVGGLTTAEIASALLVPEATLAKRITRAKQRVAEAGARFETPSAEEWVERLRVVLGVLYLVFNEGYTASTGPRLYRTDLSGEAIRLARLLRRLVPGDGEVAGLIALMLLTDARRPARSDATGALVPLAEQRRDLWDRAAIDEGTALVHATRGRHPVGQYQVQAAIAALHDEAATAETTDWPQILALYEVLEAVAPGPLVTLSRAVAVAEVQGPHAGLAVVGTLEADARAERLHRVDAVRGHLLERSGDAQAAREAYLRAAAATASEPERRYLTRRAARLGHPSPS
jgi:predicted RNA polymerase sigma factor